MSSCSRDDPCLESTLSTSAIAGPGPLFTVMPLPRRQAPRPAIIDRVRAVIHMPGVKRVSTLRTYGDRPTLTDWSEPSLRFWKLGKRRCMKTGRMLNMSFAFCLHASTCPLWVDRVVTRKDTKYGFLRVGCLAQQLVVNRETSGAGPRPPSPAIRRGRRESSDLVPATVGLEPAIPLEFWISFWWWTADRRPRKQAVRCTHLWLRRACGECDKGARSIPIPFFHSYHTHNLKWASSIRLFSSRSW